MCPTQTGRSIGFLGLVVIAQAKHPVPSRTRQLSAVAPMVLRLKAWESRSPPNLVSLPISLETMTISHRTKPDADGRWIAQGASKTSLKCRGMEQLGSSSGS